ncbi:MAG: flagellar basal body P-ring formation chaperone FlgA [Acidobacteriota bacterium]|nr:flagellar basal body P-ring formation chaperone FlgA [Acidobacteriota bacterium]
MEVLDLQAPASLQLPPGEYEIRPGPLPRQPHSGRQRLVVEAVFADGTRKRIGLQARVAVRGPMVVAARDVPRGEPLRAMDLRLETREYVSGAPVVRDPERIVGKVLRSPLRRNQPVRANLVQEARAVQSGQTVTVVYRRGGVLLEMETRARGSGGGSAASFP